MCGVTAGPERHFHLLLHALPRHDVVLQVTTRSILYIRKYLIQNRISTDAKTSNWRSMSQKMSLNMLRMWTAYAAYCWCPFCRVPEHGSVIAWKACMRRDSDSCRFQPNCSPALRKLTMLSVVYFDGLFIDWVAALCCAGSSSEGLRKNTWKLTVVMVIPSAEVPTRHLTSTGSQCVQCG